MKRKYLIEKLRENSSHVEEDAYNVLLHNEFTKQNIEKIKETIIPIIALTDDEVKKILFYINEALDNNKTVQQYAERLMKESSRTTKELITEIRDK